MKPTVILNRCEDYDAERIEEIVYRGLEALDLRPHGRTLVKPNCVASGPYFPHAHTRVEFMEGVLKALQRRAEGPLDELAIGERCGITVPTRFAYNGAKYYGLQKRIKGLKIHHFEESRQVEIPLYHHERLRDSFFTPEPVARADFFVNCPKFKAHPWTTVTFSLKNYIGIQDDRHRLLDHDHRLNEKVTDLQYIVQPQLIVTDGIIAGEGRMLTPNPFDLGLVAMGNNQVAFDAVCCHIIGVDPMSVDHIRMAHERGFGPVDLDEIRIIGDLSLDEAKERGQGFKVGLIRVEDYFEGTKIKAYGGRPPSDGGHEYCWGGCPGALEEAIEILRLYDVQTDNKLPPMHVVFGRYDKPIQPGPGEKIIFIGDCAEYRGQLGDELVQLESAYVDRSEKSPLDAQADDIFMKMWSVRRKMAKLKTQDYIRIAGCPVSVAEQALILIYLGGLKNPYLDPKQAIPYMSAYLSWRTRTAFSRLLGIGYNQPGAMVRGDARPQLNLPPAGVATPLEVAALTGEG
ncbi:MAG: DUF362 domain-containing protein [Bradymonadia bacterium]